MSHRLAQDNADEPVFANTPFSADLLNADC
jgi:hypothetical protein